MSAAGKTTRTQSVRARSHHNNRHDSSLLCFTFLLSFGLYNFAKKVFSTLRSPNIGSSHEDPPGVLELKVFNQQKQPLGLHLTARRLASAQECKNGKPLFHLMSALPFAHLWVCACRFSVHNFPLFSSFPNQESGFSFLPRDSSRTSNVGSAGASSVGAGARAAARLVACARLEHWIHRRARRARRCRCLDRARR